MSKSIAACKVEADVLSTWINFLEDTWVLQQSYTEVKEKEVKYVHYGLNMPFCYLARNFNLLLMHLSNVEK